MGKVQDLMIDRMEKNQDIVSKFLNEDDFKQALADHVTKRIYEDLNRGEGK